MQQLNLLLKKMSTISFSRFTPTDIFFSSTPSIPPFRSKNSLFYPSNLPPKFSSFSRSLISSAKKSIVLNCFNIPEIEELSSPEDEWLKKLPDKKKPLYSHSLPSIEAWLRSLGFYQSKDDIAVWFVEKPEWHAQLSLDITDLYIRTLISPSDLSPSDESYMDRRFLGIYFSAFSHCLTQLQIRF